MRSSLANVRISLVVLAAVFFSACRTPMPRTKYAHTPGTSEFLKLAVAGACDSTGIPRVAVSVLCANGTEVKLGTSDAFGNIKVPKKILRDCSAKVILLYADDYFDGAIRVDDPQLDLFAYDELFVELAPFAIR